MPSPDTYGWDTVFAISIDRVNPALATIAESSSYSMTQPVTGGSATVDFSLKNWRITDTPGGDRLVVAMDFGATSRLTSTSSAIPASTSLDTMDLHRHLPGVLRRYGSRHPATSSEDGPRAEVGRCRGQRRFVHPERGGRAAAR